MLSAGRRRHSSAALGALNTRIQCPVRASESRRTAEAPAAQLRRLFPSLPLEDALAALPYARIALRRGLVPVRRLGEREGGRERRRGDRKSVV